MAFLICSSVPLHQHHLISCTDQCTFIISEAMENITYNMFKCHHLQLGPHVQLLHNYHWHNINAAVAHCLVIQKEVNELLVRGTIATSTMVLVFTLMCLWYLSGLYTILILSNSITMGTCLYLRCQLSNRYGKVFGRMIVLSLLISRTHIYIFLLLSINIIFCVLLGINKPY